MKELTNQKTNIEKRVRDSIGIENYQRHSLQNYNVYLENFKNGYSTNNKAYFDGEHFVKNINPIFLQPQSNYGIAQLYAPIKKY